MAYQNDYNVTDWQNAPSQKSPLGRRLLMNIENGVKEAYNRIVQLDSKKAEMSLVNTLVKSVSLDPKTGILTVTQQNGSKVTYDLDIERVVTNFDINDQNELVLTLADGTVKTIDLTRFVYSVASTATVTMSISNRVMRASIVDGSVTMEKLDAAIQTELRQYMLDAQAARDSALQYQKFAKRYALGDEEFSGSETDNAKYYYEQTKIDAEASGQNAQSAASSATEAGEQAGIATQKATSAAASATGAAASELIATQKAAAAGASEQTAREKAAAAEASETTARTKATEASERASAAQRYAVGGVVPEDAEDNAEWYYRQTRELKNQVDAAAKISVPHFYIDMATMRLMSDTAAKGMRFWYEAGKFKGEVIFNG